MDALYDALAVYGAAFLVLMVILIVVGPFVPWSCPVCHGRRRDPVDGACLTCRYTAWF